MRTLLLLAITTLGLVAGYRLQAEQIKSADGRMIEADIRDVTPAGLVIVKAGVLYTVPWDKLDPLQVLRFKIEGMVKLEEDKFTGKITGNMVDVPFKQVDSSKIDLSGTLFMAPLAPDESAFYLRFTRVGYEWSWLDFHPAHLMINGQRAGELQTKISTDVFDGGKVYESVSMNISSALLARLASAASVQFRIGLRELDLAPEHLRSLKAVHDLRKWAESARDAKKKEAEPK